MVQKTKRSIQWVKQSKHQNIRLSKSKYVGIHLIAEFWNGKNIDDPKEIKKILIEATKKANNIPLEVLIHKFLPQGITGVILLAERHIALHLWPEINYLAIDIFTCGEKAMPEKALKYLERKFKPKKTEIKKIERGRILF